MAKQEIDLWQRFCETYPQLAHAALRVRDLPPLPPTDRSQIEFDFNDTPAGNLEFHPGFVPDVLTLYSVTPSDRQIVLVLYQNEVLLNRLPKNFVTPNWRSY